MTSKFVPISDFLIVLFHSNAIEKQRMRMFIIFLIYIYFHCWSSCSHQQITIFYTKDNKRLLMNLFQGQFVPLHYVSLLCIILDEKCTPTYVNRRYLVLFFSASKKNFHRHVIGFGDIPFISIVCNRAKSSKRLFHTISNLGNAALNLRR